MSLELLGHVWLVIAAATIYYSCRATWRDWHYNKGTTTGDNMTKKERKAQLKTLKAVRGVEREAHFANGGDLVAWRGGTRTVTADRKKKKNKRACRGKWEQE